jgi:fatty acid desaturase
LTKSFDSYFDVRIPSQEEFSQYCRLRRRYAWQFCGLVDFAALLMVIAITGNAIPWFPHWVALIIGTLSGITFGFGISYYISLKRP